MPLKITKKELESFVNGALPERFEEVFNDIPLYHPDHIAKKGETHQNLCKMEAPCFSYGEEIL